MGWAGEPVSSIEEKDFCKRSNKKNNEHERKYGRWVWDSRTGIPTITIIELAVEYLEYLGDTNAATKLVEVYETGQKTRKLRSEEG